jgi:hypothetical protein
MAQYLSARRAFCPDVRAFALGIVVVLCACGSFTRPGGAGPALSLPDLKYRVMDGVGQPLSCGPPVVRVPTPSEAAAEVAALRSSDPATFDAIVRHENLGPGGLTAQQDLVVLHQADLLAALSLRPDGQLFDFDYVAARPAAHHVAGTIDRTGRITLVRDDTSAFPPPGGCPICLASNVRIATPGGEVPVTAVRPGLLVWTLDASGRRAAEPVLRAGHVPAPPGHRVVSLRLADGRTVDASPGHPTADGRHVGDLLAGDEMDGSRVVSAELVPYAGDTWDLLPAGPTGAYWADGVLLGSTLRAGV